jgi:hypothetical protein
MLARDIALNAKEIDLDKDVLVMIVNRIIKDINEVLTIKSLVLNNIENNKAILQQLEKSILLMEFNQEYLKRFLSQGTLTKKDLLDFYAGEDIKDKYRLIEKTNNRNLILINSLLQIISHWVITLFYELHARS